MVIISSSSSSPSSQHHHRHHIIIIIIIVIISSPSRSPSSQHHRHHHHHHHPSIIIVIISSSQYHHHHPNIIIIIVIIIIDPHSMNPSNNDRNRIQPWFGALSASPQAGVPSGIGQPAAEAWNRRSLLVKEPNIEHILFVTIRLFKILNEGLLRGAGELASS